MKRPVLVALISLLSLAACPASSRAADDREAQYLSDIQQLTFDFERAGEAYFSPDMQWIIFQAIVPGEEHYGMYVARVRWESESIRGLDKPIRISPDKTRNTCGYFSPDGTKLIFASTAGKEDPSEPKAGFQRERRDYRWAYPKGSEIYIVENWREVLGKAEPGSAIDLAKHAITSNDVYDAECAFSPDGKWIVFTSMRAVPEVPDHALPQPDPAAINKDLELYAMRTDGGGVARLTHAPGYDGGPFFSPDGKQIVYRSDRKNNDLLQIFAADVVFDAQGNITGAANERQLTDNASVNWGPYWHPSGQHIIYAANVGPLHNYELFLIRPDGSSKTQITHAAGPDVLPVFSPDGKWLLWASKRNGKTTQVYVARFRLP